MGIPKNLKKFKNEHQVLTFNAFSWHQIGCLVEETNKKKEMPSEVKLKP